MELDEVLTKVNNNELDSMSAAELGDTLVFLGSLGKPEGMSQDQYNEVVRKVVEAYSAKEQDAQAQKAEEPKPEISDDQLTRNAAELNRNAEHLMLSDDVKLALDNMQVVKEDGSETTVAEEITEAAQLRVATDNITNDEPMSQEAYNNAVEQEIDNIMMAIYAARGRSNPNNQSQADAQKNAEDLQNLYAGQPSQVDAQTVASTLALHIGATEEKVEQQSSWFPKNEFIKGMKSKVSSLYNKLSAKLGKKFDQAKAVVATMKKQGTLTEALVGGGLAGVSVLTAVAGASVAGAAALPLSAAMGVYSVWTAGRRIAPLYKKYKEEKAKLGEQFDRKAFFAEHKKEVRNAVLYTGAGVLGATAGVLGVMNSVAAAGQGLTAARAAASFGRTGLLVTNANAPFISDLMNAETKAERKNALKRILQSLGTTAAIITVASVAGSAHAAETNTTEGVPADTTAHTGVPADTTAVAGADNADVPADTDTNVDTPADTHEYSTPAVGEQEQAFYEKRLNIVPHSDQMVLNCTVDANGDVLVKLPEGMTPEQAVHLAAMDKLYYGDDTALKALLDCDDKINSEELFAKLHDKFVTEMNDSRGPIGFPTDPNYDADPNIHARITKVDCDDVDLSRHVTHHTVHHPAEKPVVVEQAQPQPHVPSQPDVISQQSQPDVVPATVEEVHVNNAAEIVPADPEKPVVEPKKLPDVPEGHYNGENEFYNDIQGKVAPQATTEPSASGMVIKDGKVYINGQLANVKGIER